MINKLPYDIVTSLDALFQNIESDSSITVGPNRTYPVRFIFTNSLDQFTEIIIGLNNKTRFQIDLASDASLDSLPTKNDLMSAFERLYAYNSSLIYPLSEILRFYIVDDFVCIFNYLMDSVANPPGVNNRIYVPLYGLWSPFESLVLNKFHRKDMWAPIWKMDTQQTSKSSIFRLSMTVPENFGVISSINNWLQLWKQPHRDQIYSTSKRLNFLARKFLPDDVYICPTEILSYKELIQVALGISIPFNYKESETDYWLALFSHLIVLGHSSNQFELDTYIRKQYRIDSQMEDLLTFIDSYYAATSQYDKWIITQWLLSKSDWALLHTRFAKCLEGLTAYTNSELTNAIWVDPYQNTNDDSLWLNIRYSLLCHIHIKVKQPTVQFENVIGDLLVAQEELIKTHIGVLTGILSVEKKLVLKILSLNPDIIGSNMFQNRFRVFFEYQNWTAIHQDLKINPEWLVTYFREYCFGKLIQVKQDTIEELITTYNNSSNTFYKWYYHQDLAMIKDGVPIIWIDGLGAEWLPLILYLLREFDIDKKWFIKDYKLVRVSLPSITEVNQFIAYKYFKELDSYNHNNILSKQLDNLVIGQIQVISEIVQNILTLDLDSLIITSDHGSSYLCMKDFEEKKGHGHEDTHHGGRYLWLDNENSKQFKSDAVRFVHEVEVSKHKNRKCLVALKHESLSIRVPYEVHGGASPEEIMVPYIELRKAYENVFLVVPNVFESVSIQKPTITLTIKPFPQTKPIVHIGNKQFTVSQKGDKWECTFKGVSKGSHKATLNVDGIHLLLTVTISSGFIQEELF